MIGALHIMNDVPCLISVVNDGDEPDLVMVEPLQLIPAAKVYAKGRQSGFGVKIGHREHLSLGEIVERLAAVARRRG